MGTEMIAEYRNLIEDQEGRSWAARASARQLGAEWQGWVEFIAVADPRSAAHAAAVGTPVETTQHDRDAIVRWARGLRQTYLEGALERALVRPTVVPPPEPGPPIFESPAAPVRSAGAASSTVSAILDPHDVYAQSPELLDEQLAALGTEHLRDIARAYEILSMARAGASSREELIGAIVAAAAMAKRKGMGRT